VVDPESPGFPGFFIFKRTRQLSKGNPCPSARATPYAIGGLKGTTMPIPTLQPPANPVVVYGALAGTGRWTCTQDNGTVLATATTTPVKDVSIALRAASVDLSTLINLFDPWMVALYSGQLSDMPTS
jgi:hypothetical protein